MCLLEDLTTDILEEGFVKCFSPFLFSQWLFGTMRVNMKNSFVTNSTFLQNVYSYLISMCVTSSAIYFNTFYKNYFLNYSALYAVHSIGNFVQFACSFCNIVHVKLFRPNDNIKFYLILQKIDRYLHLDLQKSLYNRLFKINLVAVVCVSVSYLACFLIYIYTIVENPIYTIFSGFGLASMHIEFLAMASAVYFLATRIRFLNQVINFRLNKVGVSLKPTGYDFLLKMLWQNNSLHDTAAIVAAQETDLKFIITSFKCIIEGFKIICEVYSFQVSDQYIIV